MRRTVSLTWLPTLRILLVALITQPAAAALIHDTALRYPLIGAIVATVEACVIAYSSTRPDPVSEPTLGDHLAGVRRITAETASTDYEAPPPQ